MEHEQNLGCWLEEIDSGQPESREVEGNIGERYLLKNNPIYATTREEYIRIGGSFSNELGNYGIGSLISLPKILEDKQIPVFNNRSLLNQLAEQGTRQLPAQHFLVAIRRNQILHESWHVIATELLKETILQGTKNQKVLAYVMAEAVAITAELVLHYYAQNNETHKLAASWNSYRSRGSSGLRTAVEKWGLEDAIHSVVIQHFLIGIMSSDFTDRTQDYFSIFNAKFDKDIFSELAEPASFDFHVRATEIFLSQINIPVNIRLFMRQNFQDDISRNPRFIQDVSKISQILARNHNFEYASLMSAAHFLPLMETN
jgi:hypothetical protein